MYRNGLVAGTANLFGINVKLLTMKKKLTSEILVFR